MSTDKLVTKSDLQDFYSRILPYLGGTAEAGFTPVGTVISVMGKTAPANYLACNGQIVNIADYPELATYFEQQFESVNYFGGDGTTTFAVPDLQGEFLRGAGTNSHENQGSGSTVGTHQDATELPLFTTVNAESSLLFPIHATGSQETKPKIVNADTVTSTGDTWGTLDFKERVSGENPVRATSRPTNTSVLFCIATKNIYLNPSLDFSTSEKVVGTWIDGSTIYQKTISCGQVPQAVTSGTRVTKEVAHEVTNIDRVVNLVGSCYATASSHPCPPIMPVQLAMNTTNTPGVNIRIDATNIYVVNSNTAYNGIQDVNVTIQYTKTTD